jgi:hypothetical protein
VHQASLRQQITPGPLLGRVAGAIRFLSSAAMLGGTAAGGFMGETLGLRATLVAGGVLLIAAAAVALRARARSAGAWRG